jgi:4-carboxymuconolactone decarboxylase
MPRLPPVVREDLSPVQQRVYDLIKKTRGNVRGPFAIWLNAPELAEHCLAIQHMLNYNSRLDKRSMQLMILIVARRSSAQFAWDIHARHAAELGIEPHVVEAIRTRGEPIFHREEDRMIYDLVIELDATRTLSDASFERGLAALGQERMVELVAAVGFYMMVAITLNAFNAPVAGGARPFPEAAS